MKETGKYKKQNYDKPFQTPRSLLGSYHVPGKDQETICCDYVPNMPESPCKFTLPDLDANAQSALKQECR